MDKLFVIILLLSFLALLITKVTNAILLRKMDVSFSEIERLKKQEKVNL